MIKNIAGGALALLMFGVIIYGCYWTFKTVSYELFYRDMVEKTIRSHVQPNCLINHHSPYPKED